MSPAGEVERGRRGCCFFPRRLDVSFWVAPAFFVFSPPSPFFPPFALDDRRVEAVGDRDRDIDRDADRARRASMRLAAFDGGEDWELRLRPRLLRLFPLRPPVPRGGEAERATARELFAFLRVGLTEASAAPRPEPRDPFTAPSLRLDLLDLADLRTDLLLPDDFGSD